jgi:hypothetical protein
MWWVLFLIPSVYGFISFPLVRKVSQAPREWRRLYKTNTAVHKQNDGVYFTSICIGNGEKQCFTVIVDTGSSTIAVPCEGCDCGDHKSFLPHLSTSSENSGTIYSQCYGEGSCNYGDILIDEICIGQGCETQNGVRHPFGCCSTFSPSFRHQEADGILGISPSHKTIWKDMIEHHKLTENSVAICFGQTNGELTIGGWDNTILGENNKTVSESIRFTPLKLADKFYRIEILTANIGGAPVEKFQKMSPMIDSGSTFSFMRTPNWKLLQDEFIQKCENITSCISEAERNPFGSSGDDAQLSIGCYKFSDKKDMRLLQMKSFPNLTFQIPNSENDNPVSIVFEPEQYFFLSGPFSNVYCIGIFRDLQNVIGANLLENFLVVFEDNPARMGISKAQCNRRLTDIRNNAKNQKKIVNITQSSGGERNATNPKVHKKSTFGIITIGIAILGTLILIKTCYQDYFRRKYTLIEDNFDEEEFDDDISLHSDEIELIDRLSKIDKNMEAI